MGNTYCNLRTNVLYIKEMKGGKMTGQPGNANALKHGLFSRRINPSDLYKLGANPGHATNQQIAQLRLYLRELLDQGPISRTFPKVSPCSRTST
jgi:hypothetical protein